MAYKGNSYKGENQRGIPPKFNRGTSPSQRSGMRPRNLERMATFNQSKTGDGWFDMVVNDEREGAARDRNSRRRQAPRNTSSVPPERKDYRSTVATPPRDEAMYDGDAIASRPRTVMLGHNLDFSGLSVLIEETYRLCEAENPRMQRELPFCIFQHTIVEYLNAYLIHQQKYDNADSRFDSFTDPLEAINAKDFLIPKAIHEYIIGIGKTMTPTGEVIRVNLPIAGTPHEAIPDGLPSGSFGNLTAETHNAYESYFSPWISKSLIVRTLTMNTSALNQRNFGNWNPFPNGTYPIGSRPNLNLLGYYPPVRLHQDAINVLSDCDFEMSNTITGLLCHSASCIERTSTTLARIKAIETVKADFSATDNPAIFVFKELDDEYNYEHRLAALNSTLLSPYSFGTGASNKANYFAYKRNRTENAPGCCFRANDGTELPGFVATRNANFLMTGLHVPRNMMRDRVSLREGNHISAAVEGLTQLAVAAWLQRHCKIKTM